MTAIESPKAHSFDNGGASLNLILVLPSGEGGANLLTEFCSGSLFTS
jgi:hypothetical protein